MRKADETFEFRLAGAERATIDAAAARLSITASGLVREAALAFSLAALTPADRKPGRTPHE